MNIFLTGASSGIGQALAKEFAANGATLGLVARREDKLKELIAELPNPELHTAIVCDVTDRDRLIEEARKFVYAGPDAVEGTAVHGPGR